MEPSSLAPWRDLSIVWLSILAMILMLIPGAVFFFAIRGMRAVNRWLRLPLLIAQLWALRIEQGTRRASEVIVEVPIAVHSRSAQARVTARGVVDFLRRV
jgi:hypothetical protein